MIVKIHITQSWGSEEYLPSKILHTRCYRYCKDQLNNYVIFDWFPRK